MNCEEYAERVKKMNPMDDDFFKKMAEDVLFCEETIQTILEDETIRIEELKPQDYIKNLQGRSVVLDAHCVSDKEGHCIVEVQKAEDDNHQKRVRYNGSCVTANITDTGVKFERVPDVCSIYITKKDFLKGNHAVYHVERRIRETGEVVDNGFREVYVNAQVKDGSLISELMTIFTEDEAYDYEKFPAVSRRKSYFKKDEKGVGEMCEIMQEIKEEGRAEGLAEGRIEAVRNLIKNLQMTVEQAMEVLGIPQNEREECVRRMKV